MLKIRMTTGDGKPLVLLGLTRQNIERLQAREPIVFELAEVGLEGHLGLLAGEDQEDIVRQLVDAGLVPRAAAERLRTPEPGEKFRLRPDGTEEPL